MRCERRLRRRKSIFTQWLTPLHWVFVPFLYHLFNILITLGIFFSQSLLSLSLYWPAAKFYLFSETQTSNWSHSPQLAWISVRPLFSHFSLLFHLLLQPLWTLNHPLNNLTLKQDYRTVRHLRLPPLMSSSIIRSLFYSKSRTRKRTPSTR